MKINWSPINTFLNVVILVCSLSGLSLTIYYNKPIRDNSINNLCSKGVYPKEYCNNFYNNLNVNRGIK